MSCPAPIVWQRWLDGQTDADQEPALAGHLDRCPACAARVGALADAHHDLSGALACPDAGDWQRWLDGQTDAADELARALHLDDCPACARAVGQLARTTRDLSAALVCPTGLDWQRWLDGDSGDPDEPALAAHLDDCPACARHVRDRARLTRALAGALAPPRAAPRWRRLAAGLAAALLLTSTLARPRQAAPPAALTRLEPTHPLPTRSTEPPPTEPTLTARLLRKGLSPIARTPSPADERRARLARLLQQPPSAQAAARIDRHDAATLTALWRAAAGRPVGERAARMLLARCGASGRRAVLDGLSDPTRAHDAARALLDRPALLEAHVERLSEAARRRLLAALPAVPTARHRRWLARAARQGRSRPAALAALARIDHADTVGLILAAGGVRRPLPAAALDRSALLRAVGPVASPPDVIGALARLDPPAQRRTAIPHLINALGSPRTAPRAHAALIAWTGQEIGPSRRQWRRWWRAHRPR